MRSLILQVDTGCPVGGCSEGSVCVRDCSMTPGTPAAGCMVVDTTMYGKSCHNRHMYYTCILYMYNK